MAWTAIVLVSTGELATAAVQNTQVLGNLNELRAGGLALASQAAYDVFFASTASQLARLAAGTAGLALTTNGSGAAPTWEIPSPSYDRDVAEAEVVNTTTETTVYTKTVAGGTLSTLRMLRLSAVGSYLNSSGAARNVTVRVKYGNTVIARGNFTAIATAGDRYPVPMDVDLMGGGATNAQRAKGVILLGGAGSNAGVGQDAGQSSYSSHDTCAEDSTADKALAVSVEHSAAHASLSFILRTVNVELI